MKYRVYTKRLYYEIDLNGKYTVLCGDSGGGKSVFYSMIAARNEGNHAVHIDEYSDNMWKPSHKLFFAVSQNDKELKLNDEAEGSIFVIDENASVFKQKETAGIFRRSKHQFLLITRKNLDYLPISVENIFHLRNEGKRHYFEHTYEIEYRKSFGPQDVIVTEDSNSGLKIFREFFADIPVQSARSKTNVTPTVKDLPSSLKNILVVYDAAAFGTQIKKFNEMVREDPRNISVLDWYSFEHHVLSRPPFSYWIDPYSIDYKYESLKQFSTEVLANLIKYSKNKGSITPCLTRQSMCNVCDRIAECEYAHSNFDLGICIAGQAETVQRLDVF